MTAANPAKAELDCRVSVRVGEFKTLICSTDGSPADLAWGS